LRQLIKESFQNPGFLYITEEELKQLDETNISLELIKEFPAFSYHHAEVEIHQSQNKRKHVAEKISC
jgi:hypothetical protein